MKLLPDSYVAAPDELRAAFEGAAPADVVFLARQCLELGAWDQALSLCEALDSSGEPAILLCRAVAEFVSGDADAAFASVERVLAQDPQHLSALFVKAQMLARTGAAERALPLLFTLLARYPDYPGAQGLAATLVMKGPHYREVLAWLHKRLRPRTYFEIGVQSGATLALAHHSQTVIGVDPAEQPTKLELAATTRIFREESDAFFGAHSRESLLGVRRVDLGFVDGMHRFENALSDFANLESWAHADATILMHDCVPVVARTAERERSTKFWVGDTWKAIAALAAYRPELRIRTLPCPPSGLVVIRRLNPGSTLLKTRFAEIIERFRDQSWTFEPGQMPGEFGPVSNDERGLLEALG